MKKIKIIFVLICFTAVTAQAQIFSAIGIAGGITYGKQVWNPEGPLGQERYLLGFNGAVIAEFFRNPYFRWRSELEYNQMGTKELWYVPAGKKTINRTNYFTFNNYLKIIYPEHKIIPYILIGPRIEYLFSRRASLYPDIIARFPKIWFTGAIGIGAEIAWKNPIRPFIEAFYNHDILPSFHNTATSTDSIITNINYKGYELRIGLKYFIDKHNKDKCPAVINPAGN